MNREDLTKLEIKAQQLEIKAQQLEIKYNNLLVNYKLVLVVNVKLQNELDSERKLLEYWTRRYKKDVDNQKIHSVA